MRTLTVYLTTAIAAILLSMNTYGQNSFFIHAGPSIPLLNFADDDMTKNDASGAEIGFNIGCKSLFPLNNKNLGIFIGADLNYNSLKKGVKDDVKESFENLGINTSITYFKYINVPVIAGLNYTYKANDQLSMFGDLGLGADFFKVTDMTIKASGEKFNFNYKTSAQFAYKIGYGLLLHDRYSVELNYNGLGKHTVEGKMKHDGQSTDLDDSKLKVDILTLCFGIKF